jgi:AAHS family benzoate transporter-like MFS transporter
VLVGVALPLQQNFMAIALPGLIAAAAISLIDHSRSASAHHQNVALNLADPVPAGVGMANQSSRDLLGQAQVTKAKP